MVKVEGAYFRDTRVVGVGVDCSEGGHFELCFNCTQSSYIVDDDRESIG